ncbi:ABC transporter permease [Candidatus Saccharibacteria bacterium]|nr:ABC transporter permease [Candidatus Saccharibacteria bacterium]
MMLPQDALLLAATKLKTRRIRLIVTVIVAGLLFVLLITVSIVMNGVIHSVETFSGEGLGKRYLLQVSSVSQEDYNVQFDETLVNQAKTKFEAQKKEKAAAAKKLGIIYDPATEVSPIFSDDYQGKSGFDPFSEIGQELLADRKEVTAKNYYQTLSEKTKQYNATGTYSSVNLGAVFGPPTADAPTITTIKDGAEVISSDFTGDPYSVRGVDGVKNGMTALSDEVLSVFSLSGQDFAVRDGAVPIVAPYSAAEEVVGLTPLSSGSKSEDQLERIKTVREQIAGKTFSVCLRNSSSLERQQTAQQQTKDYEQNKDKKDYRRPDLMFTTSETPCQDVVVSRDVRSSYQKQQDAKYEEFERMFGKAAPAQRLLTFRIVGITSDPPGFESFQITDILSSLLTSSVGTGWFVPLSAEKALPEYAASFAKVGKSTDYGVSTYVEFDDAAGAKKFTKENTCEPSGFGFSGLTSDPFASCVADGKPFFINPFGSSSIALEDLRSGFSRIFNNTLFVIALISALIMMGTVGKIIADSRRETAVFRAIGAKRLDIAQIYVTYVLLVSLVIVFFSGLAGYLLASLVNNRYSADFTVQSLVSFNASDLSKRFSLVGYDLKQLGFLTFVIIVGSLLASLVPLVTNLHRNPIKDMRDER